MKFDLSQAKADLAKLPQPEFKARPSAETIEEWWSGYEAAVAAVDVDKLTLTINDATEKITKLFATKGTWYWDEK